MLVESAASAGNVSVARESVQTDVSARENRQSAADLAQQARDSGALSPETGDDTQQRDPKDAKQDRPEPTSAPAGARFNYDKDLKQVFIEIVDRETGRVINEVPPRALAEQVNRMVKQFAAPEAEGGSKSKVV